MRQKGLMDNHNEDNEITNEFGDFEETAINEPMADEVVLEGAVADATEPRYNLWAQRGRDYSH